MPNFSPRPRISASSSLVPVRRFSAASQPMRCVAQRRGTKLLAVSRSGKFTLCVHRTGPFVVRPSNTIWPRPVPSYSVSTTRSWPANRSCASCGMVRTRRTPSACTRRSVTIGAIRRLAVIPTIRSTSSSGRANCAVPRPLRASCSSSDTLTSLPNPKVNRRRAPRHARAESAITSARCSPTLGAPSVRKTMIGSRPSLDDTRVASRSAPMMFVPPATSSPSI